MNESPGRGCPLRYCYGATALAEAPERHTEIVYVIGGLYGNCPALEAVESLTIAESGPVTLCFNGDFYWFNVDDAALVRGIHLDALAVPFDADRREREFLANWPPESLAYRSYFSRIVHGPDYMMEPAHAAVSR